MLEWIAIALAIVAIGIMVATGISMHKLEPRIKSLEDYYAAKKRARQG